MPIASLLLDYSEWWYGLVDVYSPWLRTGFGLGFGIVPLTLGSVRGSMGFSWSVVALVGCMLAGLLWSWPGALAAALAGAVGVVSCYPVLRRGESLSAAQMNRLALRPYCREDADVYLLEKGSTAGPMTWSDLREMALRGALSAEARYWRDGMAGWSKMPARWD
jgi:hypothetical protein